MTYSGQKQLHLTRATQVYVMRGTNEVFTDYEKYLKRYARLASLILRFDEVANNSQIRLAEPGTQLDATHVPPSLTQDRKSLQTLSMASLA